MDESQKKIHVEEHYQDQENALKRAVKFFGNEHKQDREYYVVATFLKCLGITFQDAEIKPNPEQYHPVDIFFKDARFQITEILDTDRERHKEYKDRLQKVKQDPEFGDFIRSYDTKDIEYGEIIDLVSERLSKGKCIKYPPAVQADLDILVYVNLHGKMLDVKSHIPDCPDLRAQGWRSVSMLFKGSYIHIFHANKKAPNFIQENVGKSQNC
jgi:putative endonuclease (uncharacterized protein DUF1780)